MNAIKSEVQKTNATQKDEEYLQYANMLVRFSFKYFFLKYSAVYLTFHAVMSFSVTSAKYQILFGNIAFLGQ